MNLKDFKNFIEFCSLVEIVPSWETIRAYKKNLKKSQ